MYKHEGSYYLMAAEGGTGVNHAEVIAISCLSLMWFVMCFFCVVSFGIPRCKAKVTRSLALSIQTTGTQS